jgi:hypothetical protein
MAVTLNANDITMGSGSVIENPTGTASGYLCRAWVNFQGNGTVTIRGSNNVSSITDGGVGRYTLNFTTAMPDANYAVNAPGVGTGGSDSTGFGIGANTTPTTTSVVMWAKIYGIGYVDPPYCFTAIIR